MDDINPSYIETLLLESGSMDHVDRVILLMSKGIDNPEVIESIRVSMYNMYYVGRLDAATSMISYMKTRIVGMKSPNVKLISDIIDNVNESNGI